MEYKKPVRVHSVEKYFALPKSQREWHGIYRLPIGLPADFMSDNPSEKGWDEFSRRIRTEYPIQGFIREYLLSYDNPIYALFGRAIYRIKGYKYNIKRFFVPCSPRFRAVWPRWQYKDTSEAIIDVNFALILDFWHEEIVDNNHVDWSADTKGREFYNWIKSAVNYIEVYRVKHQKALDKAYDIKDGYKTVRMYEDLIRNTDTEILKKMVEYREYFWT